MKRNQNFPNAFTLVEILVVIVILGIVFSFITTAVRGVTTTAREARTKSIISAIDTVIQEQYDSYKFRPLPVEIPNLFQQIDTSDVNEVGLEVLASEAARVRLLMKRDLMRMELPDRWSDILDPPTVIFAAASRVIVDTSITPPRVVAQRTNEASRRSFQVSWYGSTGQANDIPPRTANYQNRLARVPSVQNQGAECLFLIMSTSFVGGLPAIDAIPESNIGDTDNDGAAEILDGWGRPLGFVRWPVGYNAPDGSTDVTIPEDLDVFRSDFAYVQITPTTAVPAPTATAPDARVTRIFPNEDDPSDDTEGAPFSVRPLIVSAGDDGIFGLALNPFSSPGAAANEVAGFGYALTANTNWPRTDAFMGRQHQGRGTADYHVIDPYLRLFIDDNGGASFDGLLPGQKLRGTDAAEALADNLSNHSLRSGQ